MGMGYYLISTFGPLASDSKDSSELIMSALFFGIAIGVFFDFTTANAIRRKVTR